MRILLINVVQSKGSTGNVVSSLYRGYKELGHDAYLIYGRGPKSNDEHICKPTLEVERKLHHLVSRFTGNLYGGMFLSTSRIIHRIKKINPDVVHLHCLNGYFVNIYRLIKWLKKSNYKVILTNHADFMLSANCGIAMDCENWKTCGCKRCKHVKEFNGRCSLNRTHHFYKKMYKAFKEYPKDKLIITGVSNWLSRRVKESPIYKDYNVKTILNPVDEFFLKKLDVKRNDKQILYITPDYYDELKGSKYFIEIAKKLPDYHFVVVDAKEQQIDAPSNVEVIYHPSKEKLRELYQSSRCTLLLSKRETFSMVALESLASNTPIIGFNNGGTESWAKEYFYSYPYGEVDSVVSKIKEPLNNIKEYNAANYLDIAKCYLSLFNDNYDY